MYQLIRAILTMLAIGAQPLAHARSVLRPQPKHTPRLTSSWKDDPSCCYTLQDSHFEEYPLFVIFNQEYFNQHLLPKKAISYRYEPKKSVDGHILSACIERLINQIKEGTYTYSDFIVLQAKDFNYTQGVGLIVLKFKDYPFVLKLFMETPRSFVDPWCKGIEQVWFFHMGGGTNRHITGLTRIRNKEIIEKKLKNHPKWADFIDTPRKWYWLSQHTRWINLHATNIGDHDELRTCIPGTYAIIADYIEKADEVTLFDKHKRKISLEICNTLDMFIDPHIDNFMVEKGTNKLILIDTEHFPTLVGLKEPQTFKSYVRWYLGLAGKAWSDMFGRTKKKRRQAQQTNSKLRIF